jgi:hypothetical protein
MAPLVQLAAPVRLLAHTVVNNFILLSHIRCDLLDEPRPVSRSVPGRNGEMGCDDPYNERIPRNRNSRLAKIEMLQSRKSQR